MSDLGLPYNLTRRLRCCVCRRKFRQTPFLAVLSYLKTWAYPFDHNHDNQAVAFVCEKCRNKTPKQAVELCGHPGELVVVYHDVAGLQPIT